MAGYPDVAALAIVVAAWSFGSFLEQRKPDTKPLDLLRREIELQYLQGDVDVDDHVTKVERDLAGLGGTVENLHACIKLDAKSIADLEKKVSHLESVASLRK